MIPCVPAVSACKWKYLFENLTGMASVVGCHWCPVVLPSRHATCLAFVGGVLMLQRELASQLAQFLWMLSDVFISLVGV